MTLCDNKYDAKVAGINYTQNIKLSPRKSEEDQTHNTRNAIVQVCRRKELNFVTFCLRCLIKLFFFQPISRLMRKSHSIPMLIKIILLFLTSD